MIFEEGHPIISLSDWQGFKSWQRSCKIFPSHPIAEVIDRNECGCLPRWFVPLARGVAIVSDALLRKAGHRDGLSRPRGWRERSRDYYYRIIGDQGGRWLDSLGVRRCDKHEWWVIERKIADVDEALVFSFGSTPVLTRSYQSAMRLAMHCDANNPLLLGLRWIKQAPDDCLGATEFAYKRLRNEALADSAQEAGHLH